MNHFTHFSPGGRPACGLPIREARHLTAWADAADCPGCRAAIPELIAEARAPEAFCLEPDSTRETRQGV